MSEILIPVITVDGKDYELRTTRALLVFYNNEVKSKESSPDEQRKSERIIININDLERDLVALEPRLDKAKEEYYDDPVNAAKKAKYDALLKLKGELADRLFTNSEERAFVEQTHKDVLDLYERCIIYAIQEQHEMSKAQATALWESFVNEVGVNRVSEWVMEIGDTLFNAQEDKNSFLARKRAAKEQQALARKAIATASKK